MRGGRGLGVALAAAIVLAGCDWAQFRFGPARPGATPDETIAVRNAAGLVPRWSTSAGDPVRSSPAVAADVVVVGSDDGFVRAYDAKTGSPKWSRSIGGEIRSSPAIGGGGVFIGSDDHQLHALDFDDGTPLWSASVDASYAGNTAPAVVGGAVYAAGTAVVRVFQTSNGSPVWTTPIPDAGALSSPAVASGLVFVSSYEKATLWALRTDTGAIAWSASVPGPLTNCMDGTTAPAVVKSSVYVALCPSAAQPSKGLFAFGVSNGALRWSAGAAAATTAAGVDKGVVFAGSANGGLEARAASSGNLLWSANIGAAVRSDPSVAGGVVYVGADDGKLYGFDAAGVAGCSGTPVTCQPLGALTTGGPIRTSPAIANGFVYVGSDDGALHAFGLPPVAFGLSSLEGTSSTTPTVSRFGPDNRLYVAQYDGLIKAYTIERVAANDYHVTATETIDAIAQIPNHDDDGTANPAVIGRLITGLLVTGSSANPVLYVSSSDPRTGGGADGEVTNLDTNSGVISRVSRVGGVWTRTDVVRGLPRSEENHATNVLVLDRTANVLYVGQGGNTNRGAPSHNFNLLPEYAYSAAVLRVDLNAIGNTTYDLPTLDDADLPGVTGPFGGDDGKRQAKLTPESPVQVFAPGFRNPFAAVRSRAGKLYVIDNASNAGWGDVPIGEGPTATCTNAVNEPGVKALDSLHLVTGPGYYGGHPNPTRGNTANTFGTTNPQSPVPSANPVECDSRDAPQNGSLTTFAAATTGAAEYTASNFADQLDGDLIVASLSGAITRVSFNAAGTAVTRNETLFSNIGFAVDVAVQSDADPFPGTIWIPSIAGGVRVFEPADYGGTVPPPCTGVDDPTIDEDDDGYTNADEIDNTTDPCSAADAPHDWDLDFVSDRNDGDDDGDGISDAVDRFAVDPNNGTSSSVPVVYSWEVGATENPCAPTPVPSGCPGGIIGLGFTGLMANGTTTYDALFDVANMTIGGAVGVLTVASVPSGTATGAINTQEYGFQVGVDARPSSTDVFTIHTRVVAPFAGLQPEGQQAIGAFMGTGDQDNFVSVVATANNGSPGIQVVREVGGVPIEQSFAPIALPGPDAVDLYLTVDPDQETVRAAYRSTTGDTPGPLVTVGTSINVPASWIASTTRGLAAGTLATSAGGSPFPATWSVLEVTIGAPET